MHKRKRQDEIIDLIGSKQFERQEELAELLTAKGFVVTQASVSRDLNEMGIVKVDGRYSLPKRNASASPFALSSISAAGDNLIVVKCAIGMAPAAGVRIDSANIHGVVGTVAGDDTIFLAVANVSPHSVIKAIWGLFDG